MHTRDNNSTLSSLRKLSLAICGLVLAGVLIGCSGATDDGGAANPPAPPAEPAGGGGAGGGGQNP